MSYQPGIPTGSVPLNQDYQNLQNNFQALDTIFTKDHLPFSNTTPQQGYHTAIHLVPVSTTTTNPPNNQPINGYTATGGFGQIFSAQINDGINTDEALFYLTGGNRLIQLTRNFVPIANTNGYTMLPGGLILQWGTIAATSSNPAVVFSSVGNIAFPNAIFNVQVTRQHAPASPGSNSMWVSTTGLSKTGFTIINDDGHTWSYNWIALGN